MKTLNECVLVSDSLMHTQTLTAKGLQYITKALYGDAHRPSMLAERLREEAVYRRKNQGGKLHPVRQGHLSPVFESSCGRDCLADNIELLALYRKSLLTPSCI